MKKTTEYDKIQGNFKEQHYTYHLIEEEMSKESGRVIQEKAGVLWNVANTISGLYLPDTTTQGSIASYLDTKCSEIDAAIASARQSIEDYKALKKSLVFEAVTGKRKVPTALTQRTQRAQRDAESLDRINRIYRIEGEGGEASLRSSANFAFSASAPAGSQNPGNPGNPVKETARPMRDSGMRPLFGATQTTSEKQMPNIETVCRSVSTSRLFVS